ncbi:DUF2270 domain-containing protein [Halorarum salinum]|uniref:DUF2270 domain-containing protein n=1 Tax=Halorarum salinum TaxID=2743089 RepID=A0A7D5QA30_9EURY|nr:DUF2270 domain-containing protein [Halobaculum salinum]QLG61438.1 DUF2270 domain-containing protein [Halobaculum salinum]
MPARDGGADPADGESHSADDPTDLSDGEAEIGREMAEDVTEMSSVLGDAYRGELDRETTWRSRLDQTTSWAVTVMAAILTWAFSSPDNPHYIVLVGVVTAAVFLLIEARRYRDYDVYRSRVRLFQANLLADALDPSQGLEHSDWRAELSRDYRRPTLKVSIIEAVGNRLRRVYAALLTVLLAAWLFRIGAFAPDEGWRTTAAIADVPGVVVLGLVGAFYAVVYAVAFWPRDREAMGEFREGRPGEWKRD